MEKGFVQQFIEWIIHNGGLYVMLFVVFAETGLFVGFFLPGDSLLFAAGFYVEDLAQQFYNSHFAIIILLVVIASFLGNLAGYWFGYKAGPLMYERKETWLFRRKHLVRARDFYHKYGKGTVFLAKFLPIVRTFAPIVAGIVKMDGKTFLFYNFMGSLVWVSSMMLGGYYLQSIILRKFGFDMKQHIEGITIAIILITTLPVLYQLFFAKKPLATDNSHSHEKRT